MNGEVAERLAARGLVLPKPAAPAANYRPTAIAGGLLFVSGQLPIRDGRVIVTGKVGDAVDLAQARGAAELCALNILAQIAGALDGDWSRLYSLVRISGFVASAPGFTEQHLVLNGASDLLADVLGAKGLHARVALGVASLPLDAAVEIEAIAALAG